MFQTTGMTTASSGCASGGGGGSGVGGALSLMGCVREASPTPADHHLLRLKNSQHSLDTLPKGQCTILVLYYGTITLVTEFQIVAFYLYGINGDNPSANCRR